MAIKKFYYELPKSSHPGFGTPGRKPTGPLVLDFDNPIASKLKFGSILVAENLSDIATGRPPTITAFFESKVEHGNRGLNTNISVNGRLVYDTEVLVDPNKPYTIMWRGFVNSVGANDMVCSLKSTSTNGCLIFHEAQNGYFDLHWQGSGSGLAPMRADFTESITDIHTYILTYDGVDDTATSSYKIFLDGVPKTVITGSGVFGKQNNTSIGNIPEGGFPHTGWLEYFFVFDTDLSNVAKSLSDDPYQILRPAAPTGYFVDATIPGRPVFLLPKRFHPGFRTPVIKPTVPVVIDYSDSLSEGLERLILLDKSVVDIVTNTPLESTNTGDWTATARGLALSTSGGGSGDNLAIEGLHGAKPSDLTTHDFSLTFYVKIRAISVRGGLYSFGNDAGGSGVYVYVEAPDIVTFNPKEFSGTNATAPLILNRWTAVTCTYNTTTDISEVYVDGVKGTSLTLAGTPSVIDVDTHLNDVFPGFGRELDGETVLFMSHRRELSQADVKALHADLYRVLKPATPSVYYVSDVVGGGLTILPTGFASSEVMGTPDVIIAITLTPTGFASSEAFGTPDIAQHLTVTPTGFAGSEVFGTPDIAQHITVTPAGFASSEALGTPSVLFTGLVITPTGFTSSVSMGTPDVLVGLSITPSGFITSESFGTADVLVGLAISPSGFASSEAFGTPTLEIDGVITPSGIPSSEAFGATGVLVSLKVTPTGISSSENFGNIVLVGEIFETPGGNMLVAYYDNVFEPYFEPYNNL